MVAVGVGAPGIRTNSVERAQLALALLALLVALALAIAAIIAFVVGAVLAFALTLL